MSLKVSAILPAMPVWLPGSRTREIAGLHRLQRLEQLLQREIQARHSAGKRLDYAAALTGFGEV